MGSDQFRIFWGDFVIYMEILERIYLVLNFFFQWQATLLEENEGIEIWCHHLPSISPLLGKKKKSYPTCVHRVMGGQGTYGSVSAGREFWPFHVTFLFLFELHCGQTRRARSVFSTVLNRCLVVATDFHLNSSKLFYGN